jgi:hypothetical protein
VALLRARPRRPCRAGTPVRRAHRPQVRHRSRRRPRHPPAPRAAGGRGRARPALRLLAYGNTFDAHRLLHLAATLGRQRTLVHRLYVATFTEGLPTGDRDTLVGLAADAGIGGDQARHTLASGAYPDAVRADEAEAQELGVQGVPYFVFDRRVAVSGARSPAAMLDTLERAWRAGALGEAGDRPAVPEVWV